MPGISGGGLPGLAIRTARFRGANLPFEFFSFLGDALGALFGRGKSRGQTIQEGLGGFWSKVDTRVHGLRELVEDFEDVQDDIRREVNDALRKLADEGTRYAVREASAFGLPRSTVEGYKPVVARPTSRFQHARVQQGRRKTTGRRPDYAELQIRRIMEPVGEHLSPHVERALEDAVDRALRRNRL